MTTLNDLRSRLRTDLHDTDSGSYRWSNDELDRHIGRALEELSLAMPLEASATVATTPGSREVSLSALTGLIEVEAVEHPAGKYPPARVGFSQWAGTLLLHTDAEPAGEDALVWYTARHTVDGSGSTLPGHLEDLVVAGAAAYAALEWAVHGIDRLNTGGEMAPERYAAWGRARLQAFHELLRQHARANGVRGRRLYVPA